jgi:nuclear pore complex protein Nup98-Nup96
LFGQASTSNASAGGFFGQPQQQQQQQATVGGLFGSATPSFGAATGANGTAVVKYQPFLGSDTIVKNGQQSNVNTKQHCITFMKEYENKSVEELRIDDYQANRKGPQAGSTVGGGLFGSAQPTTGGLFGTQQPTQQTTGLFGQPANAAQPSTLFGAATNTLGGSTFGQAAPAFGVAQPQTSQASLFNKPFSATPVSTPSTFGFGNTSTAFGANKPFGAATATGGMFGQPAAGTSTFGQATASPFGGFGAAPIQQQQQTSLFGAAVQQQPTNTGFGGLGQATNTGFGGFAGTNTSTASSFFGAKPTTGFGATTAFGAQPAATATGFGGGFGQQNTGSLFNSSLNKPTTTFGGFGGQQPSAQPALGTGLNFNTGTSLFGNTAAKPGGLFGAAAAPTGGLFGSSFGGGVVTNTMGGMGTNTFGG